MKITTITSIVAVLTLGTIGLQAKDKKADSAAYNPEEVVKKFDKNGDGKLSLEEYSTMKKFAKAKDPAAAAKAAFTELDTNKDGSVTAAEMKAAHEKKVAKSGEKPAPKADEKPAATTDSKPADKAAAK